MTVNLYDDTGGWMDPGFKITQAQRFATIVLDTTEPKRCLVCRYRICNSYGTCGTKECVSLRRKIRKVRCRYTRSRFGREGGRRVEIREQARTRKARKGWR